MSIYEEKAMTIARLKQEYDIGETISLKKAEQILGRSHKTIEKNKLVPIQYIGKNRTIIKLVDVVDYLLGINQNPYKKSRRLS